MRILLITLITVVIIPILLDFNQPAKLITVTREEMPCKMINYLLNEDKKVTHLGFCRVNQELKPLGPYSFLKLQQ